jgi:hypothetical protein
MASPAAVSVLPPPGLAGPPGWPEDFHLAPGWFDTFADSCLAPGEQASVDRVAGVLLPVRRWRGRPGLGEVASLTNYYSCRFEPPGLADHPDGASVIAGWARSQRADRIRFDALGPAGPAFRALAGGLRRAGLLVEAWPQFVNRYEPVAGVGFARYWAARDGKLRNTVDRKARALERQHRVDLLCFTRPAEAERATAHYERVYARSWKEPEPWPLFMPRLVRAAFAAGAGQLAVLTIDGEAAAAQFWLWGGGAATIFKLAHDERWERLSPGSVLTRHLMQAALDGGRLAEIDLGRGDDPYKRLWLSQSRERWGLAGYNPRRPGGLLLAARNLLPRWARRLLHRA